MKGKRRSKGIEMGQGGQGAGGGDPGESGGEREKGEAWKRCRRNVVARGFFFG